MTELDKTVLHVPAAPDIQAGWIVPRITIGGVPTARITRLELADLMIADVQRARQGLLAAPRVVIASNGSVIANYHRQVNFRELVQQADIVDPDGMPLVLATRLLLREPLRERVATTDFIVDASRAAAEHGVKFYFLGAKAGVAAAAADHLKQIFPNLDIVGIRHGYFSEDDESAICADVIASGADVLWLGLGSPLQEAFAIRRRQELKGLAWIRTCGGMFDHLGAGIPRAPMWMQVIGLEWLHRSMLEPRRLGVRYLTTNPAAVFHLLTKTRS